MKNYRTQLIGYIPILIATLIGVRVGGNENTNRDREIASLPIGSQEYRAEMPDNDCSWGEAVNGCQIGIRIDRKIFKIGERIDAQLIVRNVGVENLSYPFTVPDERSEISVIDEGREALQQKPRFGAGASTLDRLNAAIRKAGTLWIRPGYQRRHELRITDFFVLTRPGTYSVSVRRPIWQTNNLADPLLYLRSGTELIQISADGQSAIQNGSQLSMNAHSTNPSTNPSKGGAPSSSPTKRENSGISSAADYSGGAGNRNVDKAEAGVMQPSIPLSNTDFAPDTSAFASKQKIGFGLVAAVVAVILAILWRALRRKSAS